MTLLERIKEKSDYANLISKLSTRTIEWEDAVEERTELLIQIPFEREFKTLLIDPKNDSLEKILNSNFEKYKLLKGFEAIYSLELGVIECEIQSDDVLIGVDFLIRKLYRFFNNNDNNDDWESTEREDETETYRIEFPSPDIEVKIIIGESSDTFSFLSGNKRESLMFRKRLRKFQTIRLEGLKFENHNQAKELLSTIGNSVFFQIDLITNIPVHLAFDRDIQRKIRFRRKVAREGLTFTAPRFQYDFEAISLYWYARTSVNMPLLQFLAFYQVLEFYFPVYSSKDAQEKVKTLLKDPTFDKSSDKNIARILEIVKVYGKGKSFGDERSRIRATILACVDQEDLNNFFNENTARKDFFDEQKKSKSLVLQKISFIRKDHDIRLDVANRIYDLRSRVVHTKDDADMELLLPYSTDLAYIKYDIDLIEFLAKKVLIASGKPLHIKP
ncbi:MAG: hypothetical protein JWR76_1052 [Mucilaginibacter sp.]|nr:hypothetical protein [Mucilaginibacter sp.]